MTNNQKSIINTHLENTLRMELKNEGKQEWEIDSRIKYAHFANELFLNGCTEQQIEDMVQKIENEEVHTNTTGLEESIK
jgi:hypothetical protein